MGRPKKATPASKKFHNTRTCKSPEAESRVSKRTARNLVAIKKKTIRGIFGKEPDFDESRAKHLEDISIGQLLTTYCPPIDQESAKARMADALFMYRWNLLEYFQENESSEKGSSSESIASSHHSLPSQASLSLNVIESDNQESEELPSNFVGSDENNTTVVDNEHGEPKRPSNIETAHTPPSPTSSLSSIESSGPDDIQPKSKKVTGKKGRVAGSTAPIKLPRGQACTRCRSRKLKCTPGATCVSCTQAGATCVRSGR